MIAGLKDRFIPAVETGGRFDGQIIHWDYERRSTV